jgi:hypothetical protein
LGGNLLTRERTRHGIEAGRDAECRIRVPSAVSECRVPYQRAMIDEPLKLKHVKTKYESIECCKNKKLAAYIEYIYIFRYLKIGWKI